MVQAEILQIDTALMNRGKSDPRTQYTPTDTFSGGIDTQSTRGYRQSGSSGKNGTKSRFPENPNNLFPKNFAGLEKEVKADGKINYTVQAGGNICPWRCITN